MQICWHEKCLFIITSCNIMERFVHTQMEVIRGEKLYQTYKDKKIVFSSNVSRYMGLKQKETLVKIGTEKTRGAVVSATMDEMLLIAHLDENLQKIINSSQGLVTVNLKFYDSLYKKEMSFNLFTKLKSMDNQGLNQKDMHYVNLELRRKIPVELINIFGKHHEQIIRAQEKQKENIESMLFSRGLKKPCVASHIDNESIFVDYPGNPQAFLNQKSIVLLKNVQTGEIFEIIGKVDEDFQQMDGQSRIKINYSIDQQSPRFSLSLKNLKLVINS